MKLIMENWSRFVKEGTFSQKMLDTSDFENFARSSGMDSASGAEQEIIRYGRLDIQGKLFPAAQKLRTKMDSEFLIAWVTGRLATVGGPDVAKAKRIYGDHSEGQLFSKFKDVPTKFDRIASTTPSTSQSHPDNQGAVGQGIAPDDDRPSDGPYTPAGDEHFDIHQGGATALSRADTREIPGLPSGLGPAVTPEGVLPALKELVTKDLSDPETAASAKQILRTLIATLENN